MENAYRLIVVDNDISTVNQLRNYFSDHAVMNVVETFDNGKDALNYILKNPNKFDGIVMDLVIPEMDGLQILQKLKEEKINKKILILSAYKENNVLSDLSRYGVNYYMLKPFSLESIEIRLKDILVCENVINEDNEPQRKITQLLHNLGIPSHIKGYVYIRESISIMLNNPEIVGGITKEIYPEVAKKFNSTSSRVERAIRHAIEISWNRGDYEIMEEIFGHSVDYDKAKPTNSEFISTIADHLKMNLLFSH